MTSRYENYLKQGINFAVFDIDKINDVFSSANFAEKNEPVWSGYYLV